jgi:uncharacterized membrane protein YkvA (DUF1232 family)
MTAWQWLALAAGAGVLAWAALVLLLVLTGRRTDARALAGFVPDCVVLFRGLIRDGRISGWRKAMLLALIAYLALPFDLVPDFIPVVGYLDDALAVALVLRTVLRGAEPDTIAQHWPGPERSLRTVLALASL